jgi:hypothetical protein
MSLPSTAIIVPFNFPKFIQKLVDDEPFINLKRDFYPATTFFISGLSTALQLVRKAS